MPQPKSVTCPACNQPFSANVQMTVDANKEPELKVDMLRGRINQVACPSCGHGFTIPSPILFHDGSRDFLGIFVPPDVAPSEDARQRLIGDLTNRIINGIPQEQRRGYLLQPHQYLTMNSMVEAILIADGATREQLDKQRKRMSVLNQILSRATSVESIEELAKEFDEVLDREFFAMMESLAQESQQDEAEQSQQTAQSILGLSQLLLQHSSLGKRLQAQQQAVESLGEQPTREQLLEKIIQEDDEEIVNSLVIAARPLVDYGFFQMLTERVEEAEKQKNKREGRRLTSLRDRILDLTNELDRVSQEAMSKAGEALQSILDSDDIDEAVKAHADEIDDVFMRVLSTYLQMADRDNNQTHLEKLKQVWSATNRAIESQMPPEFRLIRQLLQEEYPEGTRRLLVERKDEIDEQLLNVIDTLAQEMETSDKEAAKRLRAIRGQAVLLS